MGATPAWNNPGIVLFSLFIRVQVAGWKKSEDA
jgi:hypothetical protein